jgi:hypothetical protein
MKMASDFVPWGNEAGFDVFPIIKELKMKYEQQERVSNMYERITFAWKIEIFDTLNEFVGLVVKTYGELIFKKTDQGMLGPLYVVI